MKDVTGVARRRIARTHVPNEILTTRAAEILADKFVPGRKTGAQLRRIGHLPR